MSNTYVNNDELESVHIPRNYFYRGKKNLLSMEMGKIYPTYASLLLPNDLLEIETDVVGRELPTIKPSFSDKKVITRYFVVACRNLDKNFYRFMTGYKEYSKQTKYEEPLKTWKPSKPEITKPGELWDCLGYPTDCIPDDDSLPLAFWKDAYNYIYDTYFRYEPIQDSILVDGEPASSLNEVLLYVNKDKDYFTTMLPFQQLGDPIALPLVGDASLKFVDPGSLEFKGNTTLNFVGRTSYSERLPVGMDTNRATPSSSAKDMVNGLRSVSVLDMSRVSSVMISELRFAFAMQLFQEMQARGGIRDNEFLLMHFGVAPHDETLGRPIYLGGFTSHFITSEITQNSSTTSESPLGNIAGHGVVEGNSGQSIRYHAKEFCVLLGLSYIKTDNLYMNQGMPKEFSLKTPFDFPLPIFSHLSEQPVFARELLCVSSQKLKKDYTKIADDATAKDYNAKILGYRPVYDWARQTTDEVHGLFKSQQFYSDANTIEILYNLYNWTEAFQFSIKDGERPLFNMDFLRSKYDNRNYSMVKINGADSENQANFLMWFNTKVNMWRPLSKLGTPGRIDHIL